MEEKDHWILVDRKNKHCLYNSSSSSSIIPPLTSQFSNAVIAKADSAASNHYFPLRDAFALNDLQEDTHGPTVILPDSSNLTATKKDIFQSVIFPQRQPKLQFSKIYIAH